MTSEKQVSSAHSYQVSSSTALVGSGVSTSPSQAQRVFSGAFTVLSTTGTNLPCEFWTFDFTASTGQYVSGNFTSDNPISFFVVEPSSYQTWSKTGSCGNVGDAIASQLITKSYDFTAAIPSSGTWLIVLVNSSNAKNADGFLVVYLSSSSYTVTQPLMPTVITYLTSSSTSEQSTARTGFPIISLILILIFVQIFISTTTLVLVVVALLRRREGSHNG
jgi:hypothetical protein